MIDVATLVTLVGMAVATYLTRVLGFVLLRKRTLGPQLTAALEALTTQHGTVKRVVLWGLCDAASAKLRKCGVKRRRAHRSQAADAREFVCGIGALDHTMRRQGRR